MEDTTGRKNFVLSSLTRGMQIVLKGKSGTAVKKFCCLPRCLTLLSWICQEPSQEAAEVLVIAVRHSQRTDSALGFLWHVDYFQWWSESWLGWWFIDVELAQGLEK